MTLDRNLYELFIYATVIVTFAFCMRQIFALELFAFEHTFHSILASIKAL